MPADATILPASPQVLQGDGKTPLNVLGNTTISLTLSTWQAPTSFWVVDALAEGVILAWQWMNEQEGVLDTKQECLCFGKGKRHTIYWTTAVPRHLPTKLDWIDEVNLDLSGEDATRY